MNKIVTCSSCIIQLIFLKILIELIVISVYFINATAKFDHLVFVYKKKFRLFCFLLLFKKIIFNQANCEERLTKLYVYHENHINHKFLDIFIQRQKKNSLIFFLCKNINTHCTASFAYLCTYRCQVTIQFTSMQECFSWA